MERALELAEQAAVAGQEPFGAVVVDPEGAPLGEGHNTVRADRDPTARADWEPIEVEGGVLRDRAAARLRSFPWAGANPTLGSG